MADAADFDDLSSELVDSYLLFLRGRGPEPDPSGLTADQRRRLTEQFAIVSALADRAPALPPLEEDPVAIRLGLVAAGTGADPVRAALRQLESRFGRQVAVDPAPVWRHWQPAEQPAGQSAEQSPAQPAELSAVAQCSTLGNSVALFTTPRLPLETEPAGIALFLRQHPDISAVCLSTPDAREAVLLTAADVNASVDPVRGWLEPGVHTAPDLLEVTLGRYFEARLPRWERVAALTDLIDLGDVSADAAAVAATALAAARRQRPRLQHKREAVAALKALDPSSIGRVVVDVQAGRISGNALVSRLSALAEAVAS